MHIFYTDTLMSRRDNKFQKKSKAKRSIKTHHDHFFKVMLEDKRVVMDLLKPLIEPSLFATIDTATLQLTDKSAITPDLKAMHADVIYQAKLNGNQGYIAFILEHQSTPDRLMAFRYLEYNVNLMRQHLKQGNNQLPFIVNICVYHGEQSPYPHSTDLFDCFADPLLAREKIFGPFCLLDLTVLSDEAIHDHGHVALMELLFKHYRDAKISRYLNRLVEYLRRVDAVFFLDPMLNYIASVSGSEEGVDAFLEAFSQAMPEVEKKVMTFREQLIERGMQQGMQQGVLQVAYNLLLDDMDIEFVSKATGLSIDALLKLQTEIKRK